jgi:dipeptidyl aminopeptidase/acylaminoacyl peptidase
MDYNYRRFGQVEMEEHVSGLRQLAKNRPYMDLDRLGIFGHSWGGYFTLKALVDYPDFYKAGTVMAAAVDPIDFRVSLEPFMGCLPADCSENYHKAGISSRLNNLKAPLMIIHGTADDDVPFTEAEKLVRALDSLRYKDYQFIKVQGANHALFREPDISQQIIEFFRKVFLLKND